MIHTRISPSEARSFLLIDSGRAHLLLGIVPTEKNSLIGQADDRRMSTVD